MLIVEIKSGESLEKAIKLLKRKFSKTKTDKLLKNRKTYIKPSIKRRTEISKAIYKEKSNKELNQ